MKKAGFTFRFIFNILLALFFPLLVLSIIFYQLIRESADRTENNIIDITQQNMAMLDDRLSEYDMLKFQYANDADIRADLHQHPVTTFNYLQIQRELINYTTINNFVQDIGIIYPSLNLAITNDKIFSNIDSYSDWQFDVEIPDDFNWSELFLGNNGTKQLFTPTDNIVLNMIGIDSVLCYAQSLDNYHNTSIDTPILFITFLQQDINNLLLPFELSDAGAWLVNSNEEVIYSSNGAKGYEEAISNKNELIVDYKFHHINITGIAGYTFENDFINNGNLPVIYIVAFLLIIIYAAAATLYLVRKNNRTMQRLRDILPAAGSSYSGSRMSDMMLSALSDTVTMNDTLKKEMEHRRPMIIEFTLFKWVKGDYMSSDSLVTQMNSCGLNLNYNRYCVLFFKVVKGGAVNDNEIKHNAKSSLEALFLSEQTRHAIVSIDESNLAMIMFLQDSNTKDISERGCSYKKQIKPLIDNFGVKIHLGIGNPVTFEHVFYSYNQAKDSADYIYSRDNNAGITVMNYRDISTGSINYLYSTEIEGRIINLAKEGNLKELLSVLDDIYKENIIRRKIPDSVASYFISDLKSTVVKLLPQLVADTEIADSINMRLYNLNKLNNFEEIFSELTSIYTELCNDNSKSTQAEPEQKPNELLQYIEDNYNNHNLCLATMAQQYNMSENYFSKYYKKMTGHNFLESLENARVNEAINLLENSDMPISEIAQNVGYTSVQVFRRSFRRRTGKTPSFFRQ